MALTPIERIRKTHVDIMRHPIFCVFTGVLSCGKVTIEDDLPTAATDGWNVIYGKKFIEKLSDPELRFLVLHEATHKAYQHTRIWRHLAKLNPQKANVAMDYFVNLFLVETVGEDNSWLKFIEGGVPPEKKYHGLNVQQIYDRMTDEESKQYSSADEHQYKEMSDEEAKEMQEEIDRALREGESIRRSLNSSVGGNGVFGEVLAPKVDWKKALREFVDEHCAGSDESTWRKPNRRYLSSGVYMPSTQSNTIESLVIGFDTSGSCFGTDMMTRFVSEVAGLLEKVQPEECHVVYWDTEVRGHQIFEGGQFTIQNLKPFGGGGTDGSVLFDYLRTEQIKPTAIIQLTDGEVGDWGRWNGPVLWGILGDAVAPFGLTLKISD
ncbi:MAG: hypothetical protein KGI54_14835 [Pseudomonadota bacterium]|nr:hypothetical protein [Pseudomonadota bacterium]